MIATALTIAGSDSGGGAGIEADLKTFTTFGVYGMVVLTAVTAQNTLGVQRSYGLPLDIIEAQLVSIISDMEFKAVKTGMLFSAQIVELIAAKLGEINVKNLVVDPVMVAKSGDSLLEPYARKTLLTKLLPLATVVTPNIPEASQLTGMEIHTVEDARKAAIRLHDLGTQWVVIKGGHLSNPQNAVDVVYDGHEFYELRAPKIQGSAPHGTGCTLSAAIAAELANGKNPLEAIKTAKTFITKAIRQKLNLGHGYAVTNHLVKL